jgi:hypothetical protein
MKTSLWKPLLAVLALTLAPALLHAQATRTWVSGVGDDANPCSRTAPGKTFAGCISKTVPGGEIDVLDPGGFGAVTITKSITIYGHDAEGSILTQGTNGVVISAPPGSTVVLRNLNMFQIAGAVSSGITILNSTGTVIVDHCHITGYGTGISMTTSTAGAKLILRDTTIENCTTALGIAPTAAANVSASHCHFSDGTTGVSVAANATVDMTDSVSSGNSGDGFTTTASATSLLTLTRCTSFDNVNGVNSSGSITLNDCAVFGNTSNGLKFASGAKLFTFGNNTVTGNTVDGAPSTFPTPKK